MLRGEGVHDLGRPPLAAGRVLEGGQDLVLPEVHHVLLGLLGLGLVAEGGEEVLGVVVAVRVVLGDLVLVLVLLFVLVDRVEEEAELVGREAIDGIAEKRTYGNRNPNDFENYATIVNA